MKSEEDSGGCFQFVALILLAVIAFGMSQKFDSLNTKIDTLSAKVGACK